MKNINVPDMESRIQKNVGIKIRELREAANLSAVLLSGKTGISQGQLSKIENGKATISIKVLSQLCLFFNRPLGYLFQMDEELPQVMGTLNVGEGPEKEGIKFFAEEIQRATQNKISLIALEPDQLGTVTNLVEYLQKGVIDLFIEDLCLLEKFVPDFNVFALPFVFSSMETQLAFLGGEYFQNFMQPLLFKAGIRFVNPRWNWLRGIRRVLVSKTPVFSPADIRGQRVRIFESRVLRKYWQHLGAIPVVVPWEDTNEALANDEIDVMPSYKALVYPLKFCRHARYVTEIGDIASVQCVAMNETKYQLLSPGIQNALKTSCIRAGDEYSARVKEMDRQDEKLNIEEFGAVYIKAENSPWKKTAMAIRQALIKENIFSKNVCREIDRIEASALQGRSPF